MNLTVMDDKNYEFEFEDATKKYAYVDVNADDKGQTFYGRGWSRSCGLRGRRTGMDYLTIRGIKIMRQFAAISGLLFLWKV